MHENLKAPEYEYSLSEGFTRPVRNACPELRAAAARAADFRATRQDVETIADELERKGLRVLAREARAILVGSCLVLALLGACGGPDMETDSAAIEVPDSGVPVVITSGCRTVAVADGGPVIWSDCDASTDGGADAL